MFKFLILTCLIIKTHSWTWKDYPSPRGPDYSECGVSRPTYVCDPDGMLTDQEREEIVHMVEDFKEKTKRPNSNVPCMREGLRLVVALAKDKIGREDGWNGTTKLCFNDRKWTSLYTTDCDSVVQGIELNSDGFRVCYSLRWLMTLNYDEYKQLGYADEVHLENKNYFVLLKNYIENMRMLYINRFSIFDNPDVSNEEKSSLQSSNKLEEL
uniref:Candidate secreted effector Minc07254 n=1 Tax=Meloidogyne incognita TaxID=6306 RepID=A0A914LI02_MELIC